MVMKMKYYEISADKIICQLCQHYCHIKDGGVGICGVNKNEHGEFKNLVYGYPAALNVDPIEKKPLNHFLPSSKSFSLGTVGCNFKCPFCQNWQISQERNINKSRYYSPETIVELALQYGSKSIAYTYNEPTIFYPYAKDIALLAKQHGLKNVYVTNGFESVETIRDMAGIIDAVNVDLKSFNEEYYKKVLKGSLNGVLNSLKEFKKQGIWVEVTTLIVPDENDSDEDLRKISLFISNVLGSDTPWHISAFHPDYKELDKSSTPKSSLDRAFKIGKSERLKYIYYGNIRGGSNTFCPKCNELLIERTGFSILHNNLQNGRCFNCSEEIAGVWN